MLFARLFALTFVLALLTSCAGERTIGDAGPLHPQDRVTLLESTQSGIYVIEFDGKHRGVGLFKDYVLTPGAHDVKYSVSIQRGVGNQYGGGTLRCNFAAGKTYSMQSEIGKRTWKVWIRDDATGTELSCTAVTG